MEVTNAGNPVVVGVLVNGEFADSVNVPNFDGFIHGTRGNLSIIWRESDCEDIFAVSHQSLSSGGCLEIPETNCAIP